MATKLEAPGTGIELNTGDFAQTGINVVLGVIGTLVSLLVFGVSLRIYNMTAGETDTINEVELL